MKFAALAAVLLVSQLNTQAQGMLGKTKPEVLQVNKSCLAIDNYAGAVVLNCGGVKEYYYFQGPDSTCDLYARDFYAKQATDTLQYLLSKGFVKSETRYVLPFITSKHSTHDKFPSQVYTDGKVQYCFMPVSLNGKTADLNAVIVMYKKQ